MTVNTSTAGGESEACVAKVPGDGETDDAYPCGDIVGSDAEFETYERAQGVCCGYHQEDGCRDGCVAFGSHRLGSLTP